MEIRRNDGYKKNIILIILAVLVLFTGYLLLMRYAIKHFIDETQQTIYELKGEYLQSRVDGVIANIEAYKTQLLETNSGMTEEGADELTQKYIEQYIYGLDYSDGAYIWVNQVIDYNGGDNYAIRRIHPNLKDQIGEYLSTSMTDIKGNFPYLEELEGVKANPDGFFYSYYFKEYLTDDISQKYTFARLYKPYDWIIAVGAYTKDIQQVEVSGMRIIVYSGVFVFLILVGLAAFFIVQNNKAKNKQFAKEKKELSEKAEIDPLTGCVNRRKANELYKSAFEEFKSSGVNTGILMVDIDDFKYINDTYGHDAGDRALCELARCMKKTFRTGDTVVRWGGDEFMLILQELEKEHAEVAIDKVEKLLKNLTFYFDGKDIPIKTSAGFTMFRDTDREYTDAVVRSDEIMYHVKKNGKNRIEINI